MVSRYFIVVVCLILSVSFAGCDRDHDYPPTTAPPMIPAMASANYNMETAVVGCGGGSASSTNVDINDTTTYLDILDKLDINPETVIVMANGLPQPLDEIPDCDNIEILRVVSGG